jgi:hypothetical protein
MNHHLQCRCGAVQGEVLLPATHNHVRCYCVDCRAFAHYLGKAAEVLDQQGGTEIVQVPQSRLRLQKGGNNLAAMRLSSKGMIRWYATCCGTPIGNTPADPKWAFIGLINSCLDRRRIDQDFGSEVATGFAKQAWGEPKPAARGLLGMIARFLWIVISNRLTGRYRQTPLFDVSGSPRVTPKILTLAERQNLNRMAPPASITTP